MNFENSVVIKILIIQRMETCRGGWMDVLTEFFNKKKEENFSVILSRECQLRLQSSKFGDVSSEL